MSPLKLSAYFVVSLVTILVLTILVSVVVVSGLDYLADAGLDTRLLLWMGLSTGVTVSVMNAVIVWILLLMQTNGFRETLSPLFNLKRQIDSLDLKIPEGVQSIDTLKELSEQVKIGVQAMDRLKGITEAINQQYATLSQQEVEALRSVVKQQLEGCVMEFTTKGFSVIWNSLPYHQHFGDFDDDDKVAYFNAIHTGNWQPLRRRQKSKWDV